MSADIIVKNELFCNESIRFVKKDNVWVIPLVDIADALNIDRSNLTKTVNSDELFNDMVSMVKCTTPSGIQTVKAVTRDGLIGILVKIRSSKSRSKEQMTKIKHFQIWAINTLGKVMDNRINEIQSIFPQKEITHVPEVHWETAEGALRFAKIFAKEMGIHEGIAVAHMLANSKLICGADLSSWQKMLPPSDSDTVYITATEIGNIINMPAWNVNQYFKNLGLQFRDGENWHLTGRGKEYGAAFPFERHGHSGYYIKWKKSVISDLKMFGNRTLHIT